MEENKKGFQPDENEKEAEQGFDSRNQYSGSGDFSPDQEESEENRDNLNAITELDSDENPDGSRTGSSVTNSQSEQNAEEK